MGIITREPPSRHLVRPDVDVVRVTRALAGAASLVLLAIAALVAPAPITIMFGFAAVTYGVGSAAVAVGPKRDIDLGLAGAIGLGIAVNVLGSVAMVLVHAWQPKIFMAAVLALSALVHAVVLVPALRSGAVRAIARQGLAELDLRSTAGVAEVVGLIGAIACGASLFAAHATHLGATIPIGGYLSVVGIGWYAAVAVLVGTIAYFVWRRLAGGLLLAGLELLVAVFGAPILAYSSPRSQSAEKHLAVVHAIMAHGTVDHVVDIYKAWPGFFSGVALTLQGLGAGDQAFRLATYWPLLMALTSFAIVASICRLLGYDRITGYVVATLACLANVLQQDYFSPQSLGYLLGLTLFAVCLANACPAADPADAVTPSRRHPGFQLAWWQLGYALAISVAIAVSHQFTPFAVSGAVGVLVLWGAIRPFRRGVVLAVAVAGPAIVWTLLHFSVVKSFLSPKQIGNASNFSTPQTGSAPGIARLPIVGISSYALLLALLVVGILAVIGGIRSLRNRTTLAMGSAAVFAFMLIVITPYGNEGIFRASLFAVPWLVILGLPAYRALARGGWFKVALLGSIIAGATACYLVSSAGLDASSVIRPADVAVYEHVTTLAKRHPDTTYIVIQIGPGDMPTNRSVAPANVTYLRSTDALPRMRTEQSAERYINTSFPAAAKFVGRPAKLVLFTVYSPASAAYAREYGQAEPSDLANLGRAMRSDPDLTVLSTTGGTVFALVAGSTSSG